jgi:hypothetical protein
MSVFGVSFSASPRCAAAGSARCAATNRPASWQAHEELIIQRKKVVYRLISVFVVLSLSLSLLLIKAQTCFDTIDHVRPRPPIKRTTTLQC